MITQPPTFPAMAGLDPAIHDFDPHTEPALPSIRTPAAAP